MTELDKYIESKVNDGTDKHIPFKKIPDGIKHFWKERFEDELTKNLISQTKTKNLHKCNSLLFKADIPEK